MNDFSGLRVVDALVKDLGEYSVRRLFPRVGLKMVGPWAFFDHFGPVEFAPGLGIDVRPHPHINLATVTYLFEGAILHRDSLGSVLEIQAGELALMVAGSGIVHSERESEAQQGRSRRVHGLQLWLALPEEDEEVDPEFLHYEGAVLPQRVVDGVRVRVLIGSAFGMVSPVRTFAKTLYIEADLRAGDVLEVDFDCAELAVYVVAGCIAVDGVVVMEYSLAELDGLRGLELVASEDARVVFVGGENIGRRYTWWNFVSSRQERIEQGKLDWKDGNFAVVPGDEVEFIPLPED